MRNETKWEDNVPSRTLVAVRSIHGLKWYFSAGRWVEVGEPLSFGFHLLCCVRTRVASERNHAGKRHGEGRNEQEDKSSFKELNGQGIIPNGRRKQDAHQTDPCLSTPWNQNCTLPQQPSGRGSCPGDHSQILEQNLATHPQQSPSLPSRH